MNDQAISRRDFMKTTAAVTALAAGGRLPLLGAEAADGTGIDAATGPPAVKPIRGYLTRFVPTTGGFADRENYELTYDVVHWRSGRRRAKQAARAGRPRLVRARHNEVLGRLVIKRRKQTGRVRYDVLQRVTFGGLQNVIEAQIACADDSLGTLVSWQMRSHSESMSGETAPLSKLSETGTVKDGQVRISDGARQRDLVAKNPTVSQWSVPHLVARRAGRDGTVTFDLLQDLSLLKPSQTLSFDGTIGVPVSGGRRVKLHSYAQTGEGVLPTHYLVDDEGRVQLVTASIVSWALKRVS